MADLERIIRTFFGEDSTVIERYYLLGDKGAVAFAMRTKNGRPIDGLDWGYHAHSKVFDHDTQHACDILPGGRCHYDGSSLNADRVVDIFFHLGEEAMWTELLDYYRHIFEGGRYAD